MLALIKNKTVCDLLLPDINTCYEAIPCLYGKQMYLRCGYCKGIVRRHLGKYECRDCCCEAIVKTREIEKLSYFFNEGFYNDVFCNRSKR